MALWTPALTTDTKQVWLKADDLATISESGGAVASWTDKFNSHVFSQATAGLKPTTGATTLNSKNVIDFAGDYLTSTVAASTWNFLHNGTKYRVYAVVKLGTISDPDAFYVVLGTSGGGASGNRGVVLSFDDRVSVPRNERLVHAVSRGTAGTFNTENISADGFCAPNTPLMAGVRADPSNATAASRSTLVLNDDTTASNNAATGSASASNATYTLQIGAGGNAVGPLTGYIAELIIVSGEPDANEDDRFWGYLAHEWGLTASLPSGHPYKSAAPTDGTAFTGTIAATYAPVAAATASHGVAGALAATYAPIASASAQHGVSGTLAATYAPVAAMTGVTGAGIVGTIDASYAPVAAMLAAHGVKGIAAATYSPVAEFSAAHGVAAAVAATYAPTAAISATHGRTGAMAASYAPVAAVAATHTNLFTELTTEYDNYTAPMLVTVSTSGDYEAPMTIDVAYPSGDYEAPMTVTVADSGDYEAPMVITVLGDSRQWKDKVLLAGVDVSSRLTGQVIDEQNEGAAHVAWFTLVPTAGDIDPFSYTGASVVIDYILVETAGEIARRRFTGIVHLPQYNPVDRTITFTCTDALQNRVADLDRSTLDLLTGGRYSEGVQGEQEDNWAYAQALMETVSGSLDAGRTGGLRVTNWDGLPVWKTYDLTNTINGSIDQELPQLTNIVNQIEATFEHRYSRLHRRTTSVHYSIDIETVVNNALPLLTRSTVEAALESTGWEFFYGDGIGGSSGAGLASLLGSGEPVEPVIHYVPYPDSYDLPGGGVWYQNESDTTCMAFTASMYKRWAQNVTDTYALTVKAPESITQNGAVIRQERGALASEWDAAAWESNRRAVPVLNSAGWHQTQDYAPDISAEDLETAIQTLVDVCKVKILASHRSARAWATVLLDTGIDVSRAIRINTPKVAATGKVVRVRNVTDKDAGSATTEFHIAPSSHGGVGLPEVTATVNTPPDAPASPVPSTSVRNLFGRSLTAHVGGLASSPTEDPDWEGWIVNVQGSIQIEDPGTVSYKINPQTQKTELVSDPYSGSTSNPVYVPAKAYQNTGFKVVLPAVEDEMRDNVTPAAAKTYEVPIPADEFELAA